VIAAIQKQISNMVKEKKPTPAKSDKDVKGSGTSDPKLASAVYTKKDLKRSVDCKLFNRICLINTYPYTVGNTDIELYSVSSTKP
jgi:hypothetical protein